MTLRYRRREEARKRLLQRPVKDYRVEASTTIADLIEFFRDAGGFTAKDIARAVDILAEAYSDKECVNFLSFPACIVATGLRGVIADLIRRKLINVIITTGGAVDHDLARSFGGTYFAGDFELDDIMLKDLNIHRLGNVLVPLESYGPLIEKVTWNMLDKIVRSTNKTEFAVWELLHKIGKLIKDENSILRQAYLHNVKIFVPGIVDSAFGTSIFTYSQTHKFKINPFLDMKAISDIIWEAKKCSALMIGGGISKHHTIWWNQFRGGLDYAVYITTATEYDGSLSGARLREAISWGKLKKEARHVTIQGEATVILPLIIAGVYNKLMRANYYKNG